MSLMSLDYTKLISTGRAHSIGRLWTNEELATLVEISKKTNLPFVTVAPYIRDGVLSFEDYQKAVKKGEASTRVEIRDGVAVVEKVVQETKPKTKKKKNDE